MGQHFLSDRLHSFFFYRNMMVKKAMFVRGVNARGFRYLQVVESYLKEGVSRHRVLVSLGRCNDRVREQKARDLIRDYRPLKRAQVVIAELEEVAQLACRLSPRRC
jgi:hypothetical protein